MAVGEYIDDFTLFLPSAYCLRHMFLAFSEGGGIRRYFSARECLSKCQL